MERPSWVAHNRSEEMEGLQIRSFVLDTVVPAKSVHGSIELVQVARKRSWLQNGTSSWNSRVEGELVQN